MNDTAITYGEARTRAEKICDEILKARIIRGMELLREKWGEDFVDHIDPGTLSLASPNYCVLGQLYDNAEVTIEQWRFYRDSPMGRGDSESDVFDATAYEWGLAVIDGPLIESKSAPVAYGFLIVNDDDEPYSYSDLTDAWRFVLGCDPGDVVVADA